MIPEGNPSATMFAGSDTNEEFPYANVAKVVPKLKLKIASNGFKAWLSNPSLAPCIMLLLQASARQRFARARLCANPCYCFWQNAASKEKKRRWKKGWSSGTSTLQRFLHYILAHCLVTASRVEFCLLCCQPEPVPQSLPARTSQFTLKHPCRLLAWPRWTIHMLCRT